MRLAILYETRPGPWGGGNQFLKALRGALEARGQYAARLEDADAVLFNSHHLSPGFGPASIGALIRAKRKNPRLAVLHRVDGPIASVRGAGLSIDRQIFRFNDRLADGTVFQSEWSRAESEALGLAARRPHAVIRNAPDPALFFPAPEPPADARVRLVASSWSSNMRKGFAYYQTLDDQLDWSRFSMTFVGNSPIAFRNIETRPPMHSASLAAFLREQQIYVTASEKDPCSNALIEGQHSGLPAVALRSGGHPEIVGEGGLLFDTADALRGTVDDVARDLSRLRAAIRQPSLDDVTAAYLAFAEKVAATKTDRRPPGRVQSGVAFAGLALRARVDRIRR